MKFDLNIREEGENGIAKEKIVRNLEIDDAFVMANDESKTLLKFII